jgi:hypothetical protein
MGSSTILGSEAARWHGFRSLPAGTVPPANKLLSGILENGCIVSAAMS